VAKNPMLQIEKVKENNKQRVIDYLQLDVIRHVFAFYDIQHEPDYTTMYVAFENGSLRGYVLIYTALEFPSVILECENDTAEELIEYAPENRSIMHVPPNLLPIVKRKIPNAKCYVEDWMLVKTDDATFFRSKLVRRLRTKDDASKLAMLLSSRKDRTTGTVKKYFEMISKQPIYGVFANGELVSYAGSFIQLPQVWMIGGVYTHPKQRSKGYATLATSAVTEGALRNAETAALFVRSDNYSAVRVYEKIGYKKIGEKLWVDAGTGMKP
jgi:ribosomal protein S18 acetylase RimI-like enzyme